MAVPTLSNHPHGEGGIEQLFSPALRRMASIAAIVSTLASATSCATRQENAEYFHSGRTGTSLNLPAAGGSYTERYDRLTETRRGQMALILASALERLGSNGGSGFLSGLCDNVLDKRDLATCAGARLENFNPLDRSDILRLLQYKKVVEEMGERLPSALAERCDGMVRSELCQLANLRLAADPINELDLALRFVHRVRGECDARMQRECDRSIEILRRNLQAVPLGELRANLEKEIGRQEEYDSGRISARRQAVGEFSLFQLFSSSFTQELSTYLAGSCRWQKTKDGWRCAECPGGQSWILEVQLDDSAADSYLAVRREDNPAIVMKLPYIEAARCIIDGREESLFARAYESYERGESSKLLERLRGLDLSKYGSTLYLPVYPKEYNQVISANLVTTMLFSRVLGEHYGQKLRQAPVLFTDSPLKDIETALRSAGVAARPGERVFLDLSAHGNDKGAYFGGAFSAHDLCELAKRFPDHAFMVKTIACHGGGMREGLEREFLKSPELKPRITLIVETRPELVNELSIVGRRRDVLECNHIRGSRFQNYLLRALLSDPKRNLGDAIREADRLTREHSGYDPEVLQNGELISAVQPARGDAPATA